MKTRGVCYRTIERQGRLRIPADLILGIRWLPHRGSAAQICRGWLGGNQQLQVAPTSITAPAAAELFTALDLHPAEAREANAPWADLARYAVTEWNIRCSYESTSSKRHSGDRITFTLPKELQKLKILPPVGSLVAVFWTDGIFEFWDANKWISRGAAFAVRQNAPEIALSAIDERGD